MDDVVIIGGGIIGTATAEIQGRRGSRFQLLSVAFIRFDAFSYLLVPWFLTGSFARKFPPAIQTTVVLVKRFVIT